MTKPRPSAPRLPVAQAPDRLPALLVEDDPHARRSFERVLESLSVDATVVTTADDAMAALAGETAFAAAFVDVYLASRPRGLELVRHIRSSEVSTRCLLMTAFHEPELVNEAQLLGVEILLKPFGRAHLAAFVERVRAQLDPLAQSLTPAERNIVELARTNRTRKEIAEELGVSENTVKTHTTRLLSKTGDPSLAVLVARINARER